MSQLKKEFQQKDVQRLRNLIQGKTGDKTSVSSGYVKKQNDYKEGDTWQEDGRTWTIKRWRPSNAVAMAGRIATCQP